MVFAELFVEVAFARFDVILTGVEAEGQGVAGRGLSAQVRAWTGAGLGVLPIGIELGDGRHFQMGPFGLRVAGGGGEIRAGGLLVVEKTGKRG
jgi:hypothetical protein